MMSHLRKLYARSRPSSLPAVFTPALLLFLIVQGIVYGTALYAADVGWQQQLASWREDRAASLQAPDGWFSLVGLEWLTAGPNTVGATPENRLRLPPHAVSHLGVLNLQGNAVTLAPPSGGFPAGLTVAGHSAQADVAVNEDTPLRIGTLTLLVIHRGDRFALRIKDADAPTRLHFHGLRWYAPNDVYRIQARWVPYVPAHDVVIPTIIGTTLKEKVPGAAEFTIHGKILRLEPIVEDGKLFFILRDQTSHTTTYGASRFLYTALPDHGLNQPGSVVLDFNRLTNPPCAYTPYATCPLPPKQNQLPVSIPAGEQRYHVE